MLRFKTIISDPPWTFQTRTMKGRGKSPDQHYPVMTKADICALPVAGVAMKDAILIMWTTWPHLADGTAQEVIRAWDFVPVTGGSWIKMYRAAAPRLGTGYHQRSCSEPYIIAKRGKGACPAPGKQFLDVMFHPTGPHSAKPDEQYERAELYPPPYLEMFARPDGLLFPPRENWTRIGNEMDGLDIKDALRILAEQGK